jgi:phosphoribosylformylglycinamidine cyclo-ligase
MSGLTYSQTGVDTGKGDREKESLGRILAATLRFRRGLGESLVDNGYYAAAVRVAPDLAVAITTDGVGSKILVAEQMGKLDTIGIDCVAMNVNDLICIGAEPICLVDYIAVERLHDGMLAEIAKGLVEGARRANVCIPGGETAQLPDIIRGATPGRGLDLAGTAIGVVAPDRILTGRDARPGDVVLGLASDGVHSNGFTLARRALFGAGGLTVKSRVPELDRTVGEELLAPTRIYVREVLDVLASGAEVKALLHVTGGGFLNLLRVAAPVGFELASLPPPPPVFELIRKLGAIDWAEMYGVYNMGVGFVVVVSEKDAERVRGTARRHGTEASVIGRVTAEAGVVRIPQRNLVGTGAGFRAV